MNPRTHAEIARELAQDLRSSNPKLTEEQSLIEASRKLKTFSAGALGAVSTLSARELVANDPRTHAEKARAVALDMRAKDPRISEHDAILAASKLVHDIDRGAVNAATVGYLRAVSR
jgi:hypothetical protein